MLEIQWYVLLAIIFGSSFLGMFVVSILAMGRQSDMEMEIIRLREELSRK